MPAIRRLDDAELERRIGPQRPEEPSYVRHDDCSDDEIMENFKLRIPPKFCKPLKSLQLVEGNKAYLECTVTPQNDPSMVIEWFKDRMPIMQGSRIKIASNEFGFCVLEFLDVWARDGGVYTCKATNNYGGDEMSCTISVVKTDELVQESQLPEEMRGGYEHLNYIESLKGANTTLFDYDEDPEPPVIVQAPETVTVMEGQSAKFICRVHGYPPPKLHWYKNEEILTESKRVNVWYDGIHHLEIPRTRFYDAGQITVIARNPLGEDRRDTELIVQEKPNVTANLKHVQRSFTDSEVKKIRTGRASTDEETPELKEAFRKARHDKPLATTWSTLESKIDYPNVQVVGDVLPPSFLRPLRDTTVSVGDMLILEVEVVGNPPPKVLFAHKSIQLKPNNRMKIEGTGRRYKLVISNAKISDSGLYECKIGNTAGQDTTQAMVTVNPGQPRGSSVPPGLNRQNNMQQQPQGFNGQANPQIQSTNQWMVQPPQPGQGMGMPNQQQPMNMYNQQQPMGIQNQPQPMGMQNQQQPMGMQNQQQPMGMQNQQQPMNTFNQHQQPMGMSNQQQPMNMYNQHPPMGMQNQQQPMGMQNQQQPMGMQNQQPPMGMQNQQQPMGMQNQQQPMGMQNQQQPMGMQNQQQPMGMQNQQQPIGMQNQQQPMGMQNQQQPFVRLPLSDRSAPAGQPFTLTCQIMGAPSSIRWTKNGNFLQSTNKIMAHNGPDGVFNLTFRSPAPEDSGYYSCVVMNSNPPVSTACNLTILSMGGPGANYGMGL